MISICCTRTVSVVVTVKSNSWMTVSVAVVVCKCCLRQAFDSPSLPLVMPELFPLIMASALLIAERTTQRQLLRTAAAASRPRVRAYLCELHVCLEGKDTALLHSTVDWDGGR